MEFLRNKYLQSDVSFCLSVSAAVTAEEADFPCYTCLSVGLWNVFKPDEEV